MKNTQNQPITTVPKQAVLKEEVKEGYLKMVIHRVIRLDLVTYLKCRGINHTALDTHRKNHVTFLYEDSPAYNEAVLEFEQHRALVEPQLFNAYFKDVLRIARETRMEVDQNE